jgi:protein O-mannosyl-transferase
MPAPSHPAGTSTRRLIPVGRAEWLRLVSGAILVAGAIAAYSRTFSVPLLFDDHYAIADNLTIRHWSTALWPPGDMTTGGRPILNLSLAINYAISGTAVWSYHALNLAIHVLAGLTLFGIVRRTLVLGGLTRAMGDEGRGRRTPPHLGTAACGDAALQADATLFACSVALLWTLHPLQTESVTYIVQRAESLMGLFYLLTLYCFIRGAGANDRRHRAWYALSVAVCLLGMATKEVMISAPLIVLLYDRTFLAGSFREAWRRRWGLHVALAATWLLLLGLVAGAGWDRNGAFGIAVGLSPWAYWLTQFEAVTRYLWLSVWPHPLVFEYGTFWVNRPAEVARYALAVVGLAVAVLVALWRRPVPGFLGAGFFVILAPTSIMPGRFQMIVEHRMYLPLAAVTTLAAIGIHAAVRRQSWMAFAALALGLGLLTARRNEDYRSESIIWSDTVAKRPNNERAHNNLGFVWSRMPGRLNDAVAQFEEALRLKPDYAEAHNNLGSVWSEMPGRSNDAAAQFEEALRVRPGYAEAHNNLANAWATIPGRLNDAIIHYEAALRLKPDFVEAHFNLGLAWWRMPGRLNDAAAQFEAVLRLQPNDAGAHKNLGLVWSRMPGRLNDAAAQLEAVLRLQPDDAAAHKNLGLVWSRMPGRLNDAIAELEEALRLSPNDPAIRPALAAALQQAKDH